jgi:hypothetical protein
MLWGVEHLAERLAQIPGVVAVALGGSRAQGRARADSDWDFGLYYRNGLRADDVRALGLSGEVQEPGQWGRIMNGGAWLVVEGQRVDLIYRRMETVEHWLAEAEAGRFEIDLLPNFVAGIPTYVLVGEMALSRVLWGELPKPAFPELLKSTAPPRWYGHAAFALANAEVAAARGDVAYCVCLLARAAIAAAQARLAERGRWALNEKAITADAGLDGLEALLSSPGRSPEALKRSVAGLRAILGIRSPGGLKLDQAVMRGHGDQ